MNPLEGRKALDLMERQVGEYGARAFKFYNVRYDFGKPYPWRMDDPDIAFPIFEKARENLYASIAATINFVVRAPRMFAEIMGKLLFWCGCVPVQAGVPGRDPA